MYSEADIDSLSVGQLRKLLKGGSVRVRKCMSGSGMKVGLSKQQLKKLDNASAKDKMTTLTLDPYQMDMMRGSGIFDNIFRSARQTFAPVQAIQAPAQHFFERSLPSALIHQGLPEAGAYLGGMAGTALAPELGPVSSFAGSRLGRMAGKKLAEETGRRTGYGVKKGRGQPIEDQQFSLSDVARTGKRMFGRGQPIEDQQFSLSDVARTGKRMFGGKVQKGKGVMGDMMKMMAPHVKKAAKEVARKAGSHALHKVLPQASERLGEMGGEYFGVQGGKDMGRMLGQMIEQEVASRTGLGMKKRGRSKKGGALMVAGVR